MKLFYNDTYDTISVYDRNTKKSQKILDGKEVILAPDNNYIFYKNLSGMHLAKNLKTNKSWNINISGAFHAVFSPDSKYLLISKAHRGIADIRYYKIYVLDYKNKRTCTLFKGKGIIPGVDWK